MTFWFERLIQSYILLLYATLFHSAYWVDGRFVAWFNEPAYVAFVLLSLHVIISSLGLYKNYHLLLLPLELSSQSYGLLISYGLAGMYWVYYSQLRFNLGSWYLSPRGWYVLWVVVQGILSFVLFTSSDLLIGSWGLPWGLEIRAWSLAIRLYLVQEALWGWVSSCSLVLGCGLDSFVFSGAVLSRGVIGAFSVSSLPFEILYELGTIGLFSFWLLVGFLWRVLGSFWFLAWLLHTLWVGILPFPSILFCILVSTFYSKIYK